MVCLMLKLTTIVMVSFGFILVGCGKKPQTKDGTPEVARPELSVIEEYLRKQDVSCESNQACPNYISKIVVVHNDQYKFCTGFLTEENVVATSSTCLPRLLRQVGADCSRDVFFFFPKTSNRPAERVGCSEVLQASDLDGNNPILWRDDVSFLKLSKDVPYRRQAAIIREGVANNKQFTTWMVDQQGEFTATIKKGTCESVHNNYINPLVLNESSPGMLFADCPLTVGGTGAPIIDNRGKVRAIVSAEMDKKLRAYLESTGLLVQGLKEMSYASNFACAPTNNNDDQLDERECLKDLNYSKVDDLRSQMLSTTTLFSEMKKRLEESLTGIAKHIFFGVKLIPEGDIQRAVIFPKCFRPLEGWLASYGTKNNLVEDVVIPVKAFKRTMDVYGRIQAIPLDSPSKNFYVQYSLKNLRAAQKSSVLMWSGNEPVQTTPGISQVCGPSLF